MILLDLNYTLVGNSKSIYPYTRESIEAERYRLPLIQALRGEFVILITVRDRKWQELTLECIKKHTGWQPDDVWFAPHFEYGGAPATKLKGLHSYVFPKYGNNPKDYLAVESNPKTRLMYNENGIRAIDQVMYRKEVDERNTNTLL